MMMVSECLIARAMNHVFTIFLVEVHFTETEYRSVEGRSFELCVETGDDDLRTFIQLILIIGI